MNRLEESIAAWPVRDLPASLAARTRRVYDRMAAVYPVSTMLFHSRAHRHALDVSGIRNGMRVLEVATGSGEMFRRLVRANGAGATLGVDLSPNMAARTQRTARERFPNATTLCQAVDARQMPFRNESFDAVFCCYLLELLPTEDLLRVMSEFRRVLREHGRLTLVMIGENTPMFNMLYRAAGKLAPAFWGRQVEMRVPAAVEQARLRIVHDRRIRQGFYPSRVIVANK